MTFYPLFGNSNDLQGELRKIGCDEKAISILNKKFDIFPVKIIGMKTSLANIVKQEMISCKGDAVVNEKTVSCTIEKTDVLLLGTESVYLNFFRKMEYQNSPALYELSKQLRKLLENYRSRIPVQKTRNNRSIIYSKPVIMGILNLTGDSFYDGGKYTDLDKALERCDEMILEGADIIDIGAESTKPGSLPVSKEYEIEKIIPVVRELARRGDIVISVDTNKAEVAEEALSGGADIINDISAMTFDPAMADVVKRNDAIAVLMHIRGKPADMQKDVHYDDIIRDVVMYFDEKVSLALDAGIFSERLIIDPGIGFGKRLEDNAALIKNISTFRKYGMPILLGASRKSFIGYMQGRNAIPAPADERLYGTLGIGAYSYIMGADILRVHDVKEHREMLNVLNSFK
jgi:dihydropteroate synthase